MENSSTILMLSYHFYPSNEIGARRVTELARYLSAHGVRVVVVSTFGDQPLAPGAEILPGVIAIPVARPERAFLNALVRLKRSVAKRASVDLNIGSSEGRRRVERKVGIADKVRDLYFRVLYFVDGSKRWAWRASKAAVSACAKYDARLLVASGPPPSALLAGALVAAKVDIPYVADLRDPWSDYVAVTYPNRRVELRLLRSLERWVMYRSAAVTSTGGDVAVLLKSRCPKLASRIHVVRNGYDGAVQVSSPQTAGRLSILFAGELYVGRNPFPLLSGIEWLLARPDIDAARIDVTFMGKVDVYAGQSLTAWMHGKRCASVVRLLPPQKPPAVQEAISRSTLLLNLAQQQQLSVPAKTFEQLASGREILVLCEDDCETARLVSGISGVTQVDPANFDKLTDVLLDVYRRHVVNKALTAPGETEVAQFSRTAANEHFYRIFSSVAQLEPHSLRAAANSLFPK